MKPYPHPLLNFIERKTEEHFRRPDIQEALKKLEASDIDLNESEKEVRLQFTLATAIELYDALEYTVQLVPNGNAKTTIKKTLEKIGPLPPLGVHATNKFSNKEFS